MIVAPVLLFILMLIVQAGLVFHARNVAENAAQQGAAAGRRFDGTEAQAAADARAYLTTLSTTLTHQRVTAHRTTTTALVTVEGTVISLVPGLHLHVSESSSGPVERFVPPAAANGAAS